MGSMSYLLSQLSYQAPLLLVCLAGIVASVAFLPRARAPALLALIGTGVWLIVALAVTALQAYFIRIQMEGARSSGQFGHWMTVVGVVGGALRAIALGLIVTAVFVGRPPRPAL